MVTVKLSIQQAAFTGFTHAAKITYADLVATAATTKTLALWPETGDGVTTGLLAGPVALMVETAFAGSTTLVAEIGDSGNTDSQLTSRDCMATAGTVYGILPATAPCALAGTGILGVLFTGGADLTTLTAGKLWVFYRIVDLAAAAGVEF